MPKRRYAIIGTGALGGYYGGLLQRAGFDVHFLVHSDYQHILAHGLNIESTHGDFTLPKVHAYNDPAAMPRCDVVIVCLKTTENHILCDVLPRVVFDRSVVVVLQNGLGAEPHVADIVGPGRVMGGVCFLCANKVGPGHVQHLDYGTITLADYHPDQTPQGVTPRMKSIAADLRRSGIEVRLSNDLAATRWAKLVWNIPFNGLSVVLRRTTDHLMADHDARTLAEALMHEVVADARACGVTVNDRIVQKMLDNTAKMTPYRTSMMIDFDRRRPLEIESIFGQPLRQARYAGAHSPHLEFLYHQLLFLDRINRQTPRPQQPPHVSKGS